MRKMLNVLLQKQEIIRPTQPLPSAGRKMSTGQTCGWQVKLCDPSLTRAIPERFRGEFLMKKSYTKYNLRLLTYLTV